MIRLEAILLLQDPYQLRCIAHTVRQFRMVLILIDGNGQEVIGAGRARALCCFQVDPFVFPLCHVWIPACNVGVGCKLSKSIENGSFHLTKTKIAEHCTHPNLNRAEMSSKVMSGSARP